MDQTNANYDVPADLNRLQSLGLGIGVIGIIILAAAAFLGSGVEPILRAYLLGRE
jgi:hypothetical protein